MPHARPGGAGTVDPVGVVPRLADIPAQPAMPDPPGLVHPRIQAEFEERPGEVVLGE